MNFSFSLLVGLVTFLGNASAQTVEAPRVLSCRIQINSGVGAIAMKSFDLTPTLKGEFSDIKLNAFAEIAKQISVSVRIWDQRSAGSHLVEVYTYSPGSDYVKDFKSGYISSWMSPMPPQFSISGRSSATLTSGSNTTEQPQPLQLTFACKERVSP